MTVVPEFCVPISSPFAPARVPLYFRHLSSLY